MTHEEIAARIAKADCESLTFRELAEYAEERMREDYLGWSVTELKKFYNDLFEDEQESECN